MPQAKKGDIVKVHYTGKLENEVPFDTSEGADPLQFKIGESRMISGFENAVLGMSPGESKTVKIPPEEAYGKYREDRVFDVDKSDLPEGLVPEIGMTLEICSSNGRVIPVEVKGVSDTAVTLDANHPLVEQTLIFEIRLEEIVESQ